MTENVYRVSMVNNENETDERFICAENEEQVCEYIAGNTIQDDKVYTIDGDLVPAEIDFYIGAQDNEDDLSDWRVESVEFAGILEY